jgi:hypothetical protein
MMLILSCSSGKNWIEKKIADGHLLMTKQDRWLGFDVRTKGNRPANICKSKQSEGKKLDR